MVGFIISGGGILAMTVCLAFPAMAEQSSSANYEAPPGLFVGGGGQSSSANYEQTGMMGFSFAQGDSSSANYQSGLAISTLLPAALGLNLSNLTFAGQSVGTSSTAQVVTLSNSGSGALSISSIAANGDFRLGNSCGATLAAGASCTLSVTFTPTAAGARSGMISITSSAAGGPHRVDLSGTGVADTGQTGSTVLSLAPSWNLLGNSNNASLDVTATLGNPDKVSTVWKWVPTTGKWAFYTPSMTATALATYAASKGYDVLATINGGEGFWVNAKACLTVQLPAGTAINSSSFADPDGLPKGWSLIAVGDNKTPQVFASVISGQLTPVAGVVPTIITTLWAWDSGSSGWYFYAPSLDNSGGLAGYIASKGYLDFAAKGKTLDPKTGFWVNHK